uniref:Retrotransposon gag domain-containing protein n=1 Tax=Fagus sylvatica TaxID=28930 RepID=A0A2N9HQ31_FAGSY
MAANGDGVECSNGGSRGKDAMWAAIEEQRQQMNEIRELLAVVRLELNANRLQRVGKNRTRDIARGPLVNRLMGRHVLNFSDIPCFDGISYKEDFIGWILNFEDYFTYAKIPEDFKVLLVSRKLVGDAADWWNDIEYCRMRREVEQDQVLTKVEELEGKEFEERSSIKDGILEEVFEEAKEGNLELIEENGENLEAKIIGNIVEDSTEVKHEGESITHYSQDLVDLLKISTTQSIDFLGVENFNFVFKPLLVNIANQLKGEQKKFWVAQIVENNSKQVLKIVKYSKYLFIWSGRFQFSEENSRSSFIQVEEPDVKPEDLTIVR